MMEAATEAQEAYADAVSRAREVEQLVRCGGVTPSSLARAWLTPRPACCDSLHPVPRCSRCGNVACRSIAEVSQMFQDLAALVQHQSEMLDR